MKKSPEKTSATARQIQSDTPAFRKVLMVDPKYFRVEYAINPYMKDSSGQLQRVDKNRALAEWAALKSLYEDLGYAVEVLPGEPELPDMVFAANQSFPFWRAGDDRPSVVLSRMRSNYRQPEIRYFEKYYRDSHYHVLTIPEAYGSFEGNGDALLHPGKRAIWGGYGPRTDKKVYDWLAQQTGCEIMTLELINEKFYHLDTCFAIIDAKTVAFQPKAFTPEGRHLIEKSFESAIPLDLVENETCFSGNCHSLQDQNVILPRGCNQLRSSLMTRGYRVHETATDEFIKSGGSVFCMKMMVF